MRSLLTIFIFSVAACQLFDTFALAWEPDFLQLDVFYETLCFDNTSVFQKISSILENPLVSYSLQVNLIPFGKGNFIDDTFNITCQHGPEECYGNVMNACFMARHPDQFEQAEFVACCMNDEYPPQAGERCAEELGYSFEGVKECTRNEEGIALQIQNGRKTLDFKPRITEIPCVIFDGVYDADDQKDALVDIEEVIMRKLKAKGVKL